jgi:hypothetical protein
MTQPGTRRIPNADRAVITEDKLRNYLLALDHRHGTTKARFFRGLGFTRDEWVLLGEQLRQQHLPLDVAEEIITEFGRDFVIRGPLTGPNGRTERVKSVWTIDHGEELPRLVTAYPDK